LKIVCHLRTQPAGIETAAEYQGGDEGAEGATHEGSMISHNWGFIDFLLNFIGKSKYMFCFVKMLNFLTPYIFLRFDACFFCNILK